MAGDQSARRKEGIQPTPHLRETAPLKFEGRNYSSVSADIFMAGDVPVPPAASVY
ncbi:hypothetical protein TRIUR3_18173 [Triticum urartu]|uniref:Uncharacterized protein n=1 Tax=Triticum urartu TaxID=4572 RepID=M7ZPH2_TRIUA|nr:hypothetical protein TRIUR3_18173 [Triticum urartu]